VAGHFYETDKTLTWFRFCLNLPSLTSCAGQVVG